MSEALEEQSEESNDNSVGHDSQQLIRSQEYQTSTDSESYVNESNFDQLSNRNSILSNALQSSEASDPQHYYQQSVPQFAPQVYDSTPNYIQSSYEAQYQYATHPVFSPTQEPYNQTSAQYQLTSQMTPQLQQQISPQLSPQIPSRMTPQLTPQLTPQMTPQLTPQMTSQLSPQLAAQQYRPQEFHSSHQTYQPNESTAYPSEYGRHSTPEQLYPMSHLNMQTLSQTQTPIPTQLVHRSPVIERRLDISQTQTLQQNINPDLSHYKREVNASHVSQIKTQSFLSCVPTEPILQNSEDIIDFDDVSLGVDPTNEAQYNPSIAPFEQNPNDFEMPVASDQFHHHINDNQSFEEQSIESQDLAKDETDTDETYQSDTNDNTNDSISEDQIKPIESNFSGPQIITETSLPVSEPQSETIPETNHQIIDETPLQEVNESTTESSDSNETDVDSKKEEEYTDINASNNVLMDSVTNEESVTIDEDLEPQLNENYDHESVIKQVNNEIEDNLKTIDDESKSSETSEEQEVSVPENDNSVETSKASEISVEPIVPPINQINRSTQDENRPPVRTAVTRAEPHINEVSSIQNATKNEIKNNKKLTKNQKKKLRKKNRANKRKLEQQMQTRVNEDNDQMDIDDDDEDEEEIEIE